MDTQPAIAGDLKNETRAKHRDICLREKTGIKGLWR